MAEATVATKATTKKKVMASAKGKTTNGKRGHVYEMTASGKKSLAEVGGQGGLIYSVLSKKSLTTSEIVNTLGKKLVTTSDPKVIVAFYCARWKKNGFVKFAKA